MGLLKSKKKQQKEAQEKKQEKMNAFMEEYKKLSKKHRIDIAPTLNISQKGILPAAKLVDLDEKEEEKK